MTISSVLRTVRKMGRRGTASWVALYARLSLGSAFLSAVASRFGLWHGTVTLRYFGDFIAYTAQVNSFLPSRSIPTVAWTATCAETLLGVLLVGGWWLRWTSLFAAVLLVLFGGAMGISLGIKSPLDYSVFSASSAAALLAVYAHRTTPSSYGNTSEKTSC